MIAAVEISDLQDDVWRALANPARRSLLDELRSGPRTTGELAETIPEVSRFAVMQHLGVLEEAGLVLVRRQGRNRFNYLNPVPLQEWYERWVTPFAAHSAAESLAIKRVVESEKSDRGGSAMVVSAPTRADEFRTVRIETELRFEAPMERVFEVIVKRSNEWFPTSYGEERVVDIVLEPRVGGAYFEDWGDGRGHLYGVISSYDPPRSLAYRGRLEMGTILDTEYELGADGSATVLRVHKVAVGPMTDEIAAGIHRHGDLANYEDALRRVIEKG